MDATANPTLREQCRTAIIHVLDVQQEPFHGTSHELAALVQRHIQTQETDTPNRAMIVEEISAMRSEGIVRIDPALGNGTGQKISHITAEPLATAPADAPHRPPHGLLSSEELEIYWHYLKNFLGRQPERTWKEPAQALH
ncbi:hypothetical protein HYV74_02435, partial [Candidatus Uhrbacteria bacterium]|nr:hypothetical protein [Candidatus Uhrbacteria bacterium]